MKENGELEGNILRSLIVGRFYSKASYESEGFVQIGDMVKKGDDILIIESMKLMNEIKSEFEGKVSKILVKNGEGFGIDVIKKIIPHREPFLFLDEVLKIVPGKEIVAKKHVRKDEFWVKGHFPNFPICPGVITIEMLAQAGAVCILSLEENKGKVALFGGIKKARFKKQILPGDLVILQLNVVKNLGSVGIGHAKAIVDDTVAVETEITFVIK